MKRRVAKLGLVLSGLYFAFSTVVYVGSLGHRDHAWWPMFLYPVIFPCSWLFEGALKSALRDWLIADGAAVTGSACYMLASRRDGEIASESG